MGSLATFKSTYLAAPPSDVLPTGARLQLAGPIYAIERQVANGATVAAAVANLPTKRLYAVAHRAQQQSRPFQGSLAADFLALDAA